MKKVINSVGLVGCIAVLINVTDLVNAGGNQVAASTLNGGRCPNFGNMGQCFSRPTHGIVAVSGSGYKRGGMCGQQVDIPTGQLVDCGTIPRIGDPDTE
jgi:hypothetical protein